MGKRKKRKSNVGAIIMIIVIVLLSLFVYLLATKRIDFNNKNDDLVEDNTNIDNNKNNNDKNDKTISKEEAITISKEKMPVMISLANQKRGLYGYCGEFDEDADFLTIGNDTYDLSSEFKSVSEVKKYLKESISSELINRKKGKYVTILFNDATDKENCDRIEEIFIKVFNDFVGDNNNIHCTCSTSSFFNPFFMRNI
jgi:hypothetical protein